MVTSHTTLLDPVPVLALLRDWTRAAERYWYDLPGHPGVGCYGSGYNSWGVQTNQKYVGAMAALAVLGAKHPQIVPTAICELARERALAGLRFSLRSHLTGDLRCTDDTQWGHTWISALGVERMMFGVYLLEPYLTDADRESLRRVLVSESEWIANDLVRGSQKGVVAGQWNHSGKNVPESNLWNGAILWRTAMHYPDLPQVEEWKEQAHRFLINSISVLADETDERIVGGKAVKERYVGANFFPNYALDHHGYLNIGYMIGCLSNAAMLHYDLLARGFPAPESLYHHNADLWQVARRMVFPDGRLTRIGGDSRLRYTYCQEYLLPTLVYAADKLGDAEAAEMLAGQIGLIKREADYGGDGSFYGRRLEYLAGESSYYYTRLESDRAVALGMALRYAGQVRFWAGLGDLRLSGDRFDWCEPEHGAALHRSHKGFISYAWRAHGLTQGLCQPPNPSDLADWSQNLSSVIRFQGDDGTIRGGQTEHRALLRQEVKPFAGGFLTYGAVREGCKLDVPEGWVGDQPALHQIVFCALPDGQTALGLEHAQVQERRAYIQEIKGLHLNLPNDLYNDFQRRIVTASGEVILKSPPERDEVIALGSHWANIEGQVGVVGLYGAEGLSVSRSSQRRGGKFRSLHVDEICFPCRVGLHDASPGAMLLDIGWAALSLVDAAQTARFAELAEPLALTRCHSLLRGLRVRGLDGQWYALVANFGAERCVVPVAALWDSVRPAKDVVDGESYPGEVALEPGEARLFA